MEEEIKKSGLWPNNKYDIFDIEEFLAGHLKVDLDMYHALPPEIMGEAVFTFGKQTRVLINRDLTESAEDKELRWNAARWMIGRWRMTVAHEGAHVILHEPLIFPKDKNGVSLQGNAAKTYRCHKKNIDAMGAAPTKSDCPIEFEKNSAWKRAKVAGEDPETQALEWQANYAAGALLMPRSLFIEAAKEFSAFINTGNPHHSEDQRLSRICEELADRFKVSRQAASIRYRALIGASSK